MRTRENQRMENRVIRRISVSRTRARGAHRPTAHPRFARARAWIAAMSIAISIVLIIPSASIAQLSAVAVDESRGDTLRLSLTESRARAVRANPDLQQWRSIRRLRSGRFGKMPSCFDSILSSTSLLLEAGRRRAKHFTGGRDLRPTQSPCSLRQRRCRTREGSGNRCRTRDDRSRRPSFLSSVRGDSAKRTRE